MPTHQGNDYNGKYYQWGSQKKYYYKNEKGRLQAKLKADKQGRAIKIAQNI
jgi:hypothetical protein